MYDINSKWSVPPKMGANLNVFRIGTLLTGVPGVGNRGVTDLRKRAIHMSAIGGVTDVRNIGTLQMSGILKRYGCRE